MPVAGIDLGGTKLAAAAFSEQGEILHRELVQLAGREGSAVGSLIADTVRRLADEHGCTASGVCIPGLYRSATGTVWAPNIPGWDDYPLLEELRSNAPSGHVITIDSDRAAYILGETWKGAAKGASDAIFIAVGTGIGAGILVDGKIVRGRGDVAGAIGWLALDRPYLDRYKGHGCFEDQASGPGLVRVANDFGFSTEGEITTAEIFAAYDRGDTLAKKVIDNAVQLWGMAAANLVSIFNPAMIVFGGGIFGPATQFIDRIAAEARRWAQPIAIEQVQFVASTLGSDAGLYGAGRLAMKTETT
ncbi:MAG TPA: ROK family protein [Gemmatimonadaceae bacterium]